MRFIIPVLLIASCSGEKPVSQKKEKPELKEDTIATGPAKAEPIPLEVLTFNLFTSHEKKYSSTNPNIHYQ